MEIARLPCLGTANTDSLPPRVRKLLPGYFPDNDTVAKELISFFESCATWRNMRDEKEVVGLQPLQSELAKDELSRARYARSYKPSPKYENLGPRWGVGISLAVDGLPEFKRWADAIRLEEFRSATGVFKSLKDLTGKAKKYGKRWSAKWQHLVNGETLGGYLDAVPMIEFVESVKHWVGGDIRHEILTKDGPSEDVFLDELGNGMYAFLSDLPGLVRANEDAQTLEEWVQTPGNWARSGSTQEKLEIGYVGRKGTRKNVGKTKWRTALAMDPDKVLQKMLYHPPKQTPVVIQKRERGKVRAVISSDDPTYLRMAYISHWLDPALGGNTQSMLYRGKEDQILRWEDNPRKNTGGKRVNMPLDQAEFDHQGNFKMLNRFFDVLDRVITEVAPIRIRSDLLRMSHLLRVTLTTPSQINIDGVTVMVTKGILSGWRWTSLIDTAFNIGELYAGVRQCKEFEIPGVLTDYDAVGDDDDITTSSCGYAVAMYRAYELMNLKVNLMKFFIDSARNEYLRKWSDGVKVSGYPLRALGALLWRNPVSRDPPAGLLRFNEQVNSWNMAMARGYDRKKGLGHMYRDLGRANKLSRERVDQVLRTPASVGGAGYFPMGQSWVSLQPGVINRKYRLDYTDIKGLKYEIDKLHALGLDIPDDKVKAEIAKNLVFMDAEIEVEPGGTEDLAYMLPKLGRYPFGVTPLSGIHSKDIPETSSRVALEYAIRNRRWDWIRDVWLDQDMRLLSDQIERNGRRRVWLEWMKGELPFHAPVVYPYGTDQVGYRHKMMAKGSWGMLIRGRFNWTDVQRAAVRVEEDTRTYMLRSEVPVVTD